LNLFASQLAKLLYCVKVGCVAIGSTAAIVAGEIIFDSLIEKTGRAPIFIPLMAEGLNFILGEPTAISDVKLPEISEKYKYNRLKSRGYSNILNNYKN